MRQTARPLGLALLSALVLAGLWLLASWRDTPAAYADHIVCPLNSAPVAGAQTGSQGPARNRSVGTPRQSTPRPDMVGSEDRCPSADVTVRVTPPPGPVTVNDDLTYIITVENRGPDTAGLVSLTVDIPATARMYSVVAPAGRACSEQRYGMPGDMVCIIDGMPIGSLTFTMKVRTSQPGALLLRAAVFVHSTPWDGDPNNNEVTATTTVQDRCAPRPRVSVATARIGGDRLRVTISSNSNVLTPDNRLLQLRATIPANARVDVVGGASDLTGTQILSLGNHAQSVVFDIRRVGAGRVHLPLVVVDTCGEWSTFVGGGI